MADRRMILHGPDTITLSRQTADILIRSGDGDAALLYLYVLRAGGTLSVQEAASALHRSARHIDASTEVLESLGLLQLDGPPAAPIPVVPIPAAPAAAAPPVPGAPAVSGVPPVRDELPEYKAEDIRREIESGTVFSSLVREAEKNLGRLLSSEDLIKLFGIYDSLGLPPEVILHLVTYCIDEYRRRYGPGKTPTLRYIEKAAYTWEREGIFTLPDAERYLKRQESRRDLVGEIKRVMQITDRELLAGELKYIDGWLSMGFSTEEIEIAYSRTVMQTKDFSWNYMDRIIASWHQKGLHTADEIKTKDLRTAPRKAPAKKTDHDRAG